MGKPTEVDDVLRKNQAEIQAIIEKNNPLPFLVIAITGTLPGTGASTLESHLRTLLHLDSTGSGRIRRAIASHYSVFFRTQLQSSGYSSEWESRTIPIGVQENIWSAFADMYFTLDENGNPTIRDLAEISAQLSSYLLLPYPASEATLHAFNASASVYGKQTPYPWDKLPDLLTLQKLTTLDQTKSGRHGITLEGKIAIILDDVLSSDGTVINDEKRSFLRLLLDVDIENSAMRVVIRELKTASIGPPIGFTSEETIKCLLDSSRLKEQPKKKRKEFSHWKEKTLEEYRSANQHRMNADRIRFAATYPKADISVNALRQRATAVIDTTSLDSRGVLRVTLNIIRSELPAWNQTIIQLLSVI